MNDNAERELLSRLDTIIALLVTQLTQGKPQVDQIALLARVGLGASRIAEILGTTPATVRTSLSRMKKVGAKSAVTRQQ